MLAAEVAAWTATGLAIFGVVPQLVRLVRTGDTNGVSLTNITLGIGSELGWFAYTLHGSLWSAVPESALMAVTHVVIAVILVRCGCSPVGSIAAATIWVALLLTVTAVGGWTVLGGLLPIAYGVQVAPAVWCAYRTRVPSGVALGTWLVVFVECVLWGAYGGVQSDPALTMLAVFGTCASVAIVVRVLATRGRAVSYHTAAPSLQTL